MLAQLNSRSFLSCASGYFYVTKLLVVALIVGISVSTTACSTLNMNTMSNGKSWGQDATTSPSGDRLSKAFYSAAKHPASWAPLIGAALLSIGDLDEELSEQLSEDTPVFGSNEDADDASDWLRDSLVASVAVSIIVMPSGQDQEQHLVNKGKGLLTEFATLKATSLTTNGLKNLTDRERPNKVSDNSFPSGHTSRAFAAAALTSKNLESLSLSANTNLGIRAGLYSFATATAWARVEAKVHYPVDVLAGAALGNFLSRFIHDAFLGLEHQDKLIQFEIMPKHSYVSLQWQFY